MHSKIISSDMKDFFRRIQWWRSEVDIRNGKRSNRRPKMAEKSRVTTPRGRHESLVSGVSSSRLRPDSDQSRIWCRAWPWLVCDSLNELTWVSFVVDRHRHLTIFFFQTTFFFLQLFLNRQQRFNPETRAFLRLMLTMQQWPRSVCPILSKLFLCVHI